MHVDFFIIFVFFTNSGTVGATFSFVIENFNVIKGSVIEEFHVHSMRECSILCRVRIDCDGFNYLIESGEKAHCLLMNGKKPEIEEQLPHPEDILFAARKISLHRSCHGRTFAFEKFAHLQAINEDIILDSSVDETMENCLEKCHERADCRATQHSHRNGSCFLLRASPNTVYNLRKSFTFSNDVDLYENNCVEVSVSTSKCNFMRFGSAGFTDSYDEIVPNLDNVEECEIVCLTKTKVADPCRSYTYNKSSRSCYISHYDGRSFGQSPLSSQNPNLSYGSLDDCIDFGLKCRNDELEIHGSSMRLFSGFMRTKHRKNTICERKIDSLYEFKILMPYEECGINKTMLPYPSYNGLVHVKEGSTNLVTIRDKLLQVQCRIHSQVESNDLKLMAQMDVQDSNRSERVLTNSILYTPTRPPYQRYSLRILNSDGIETDVVRAGEQGWLSLNINGGSQRQILVSNVIARDISTRKSIKLIGDDGCVIHDSVIGISRVSPQEIRYKINFGGFIEKTQLIYQALVETCSFDCSPKCNEKLWLDNAANQMEEDDNSIRIRRAVGPRQLELTQDIYKVHGSRITVLTTLSSTPVTESPKFQNERLLTSKDQHPRHNDEVHVRAIETRPISSAFEQCFSDDITCLFTVILASIQIFLLASCVCIVYCYIQQWRSFRGLHESTSTQIQYELSGQPKLNAAQID
ncbi:hypothetical protein Angca_000726 [Angiostrongylus cantonensis]|nr:hypothetical protein Angca_000726 [Angiostrongylus cantonensis]